MAEQDSRRDAADEGGTGGARPYRRQVLHVTQAPIDDAEPEYATIDPYQTLEQQRRGRRHMGTATSDPEYLPKTEFQRQRDSDPDARATPIRDAKAPRRSGTVHYDRYLQTPKPRRDIFASPQARRQRRNRAALVALLIVVLVALAVIWFVFLR